jgi:hypothetical protein
MAFGGAQFNTNNFHASMRGGFNTPSVQASVQAQIQAAGGGLRVDAGAQFGGGVSAHFAMNDSFAYASGGFGGGYGISGGESLDAFVNSFYSSAQPQFGGDFGMQLGALNAFGGSAQVAFNAGVIGPQQLAGFNMQVGDISAFMQGGMGGVQASFNFDLGGLMQQQQMFAQMQGQANMMGGLMMADQLLGQRLGMQEAAFGQFQGMVGNQLGQIHNQMGLYGQRMNDMQGQMGIFGEQLRANASGLSDLTGQVSGLNAQMGGLGSLVDGLEGKFSGLDAMFGGFQTQFGDYQAATDARFGRVDQRFTGVDTEISKLLAEMRGLAGELKEAKNENLELRNLLGSRTDELKGLISDAKTTLDGKISDAKTTLDSRITDAEARLDERINAESEKLKGGLSALETKLDTALADVNKRLDDGLSAVNSKFDAEVAKLQATDAELAKGLGDFKAEYNKFTEETKAKFEAQDGEIKRAFSELNDTKAELNARISSTDEQLRAAMAEGNQHLQAQLNAQKAELTTAQGQLANHERLLASQQQQITRNRDEAMSAIKTVNSRVTDVQNWTAGQLQSVRTDLNNRITNVHNQINVTINNFQQDYRASLDMIANRIGGGRIQRSGNRMIAADPLILDLNGDGVRANQTVRTNLLGGGEQSVRWTTTDPMVALDPARLPAGWRIEDADGSTVTNPTLLRDGLAITRPDGSRHTVNDGWDALRAFDLNGDGQISAADPAFNALRLFTDSNGDGTMNAGELENLSNRVRSIAIGHGAQQTDEFGSTFTDGRFTRADGSDGLARDMFFAQV